MNIKLLNMYVQACRLSNRNGSLLGLKLFKESLKV